MGYERHYFVKCLSHYGAGPFNLCLRKGILYKRISYLSLATLVLLSAISCNKPKNNNDKSTDASSDSQTDTHRVSGTRPPVQNGSIPAKYQHEYGKAVATASPLTSDALAATVVLEQDDRAKCLGLHLPRGWVLTAGHCARKYPRLAVRSPGGTIIPIISHRTHPSIDLALLHVEGPLHGQVFDMKQIASSVPVSGSKLKAIFTDDQGRLNTVDTQLETASDELVVGYGGSRGPCTGDSGSALMIEHNGEWRLAGLLRGGARGCRGPDRYMCASEIRDWLEEFAQQEVSMNF